MRINIKPLSVNLAWQGSRYKTKLYKEYEKKLLLMLPRLDVGKDKKLEIYFMFGFSNVQSDLDNPVKLLIDIFQKKYNFNDSYVWRLVVDKQKVEKGKEFIDFDIKVLEI